MKVFYISNIYKDIKIANRFLKHFIKVFPKKTSELLLYCHDLGTYKEALNYDSKNINIIRGSENVYFTEAVNICIGMILKNNAQGNICMINSDCFGSKELHDICLKNKNRGLIFRNRDFKTNYLLPAGFIFNNKIIGDTKNIEDKISKSKKKYFKIDYSNGRGLTFPVVFARKHGLLNHKDFPQYGSDNDYSWKISNTIGLYYCVGAEILSDKFETGFNPMVIKMSLNKRIKALFSIKSNINILVRCKLYRNFCTNNLYKPIWIMRGIISCLLIACLPYKLKNRLSKFK